MSQFSNQSHFEQLRLWQEEVAPEVVKTAQEARAAFAKQNGLTIPDDDVDRLSEIVDEFRSFFDKAGSFDRKWLGLCEEAEDILRRQR